MTKRKCMRNHPLMSGSLAERFVLFHDTRFRIALACHESWCPVCVKARRKWFICR